MPRMQKEKGKVICLIIHRVGSANVPEAVIEHNRRYNPDGFGIAWREDGKLLNVKFGPSEFKAFRKLLKHIDRQKGVEYVAHFRKATHGAPCQELSHPFAYEDKKGDGEVLVFHNGIISIAAGKGESDTSAFVKQVLSRMSSRWWVNPAYKFLVENSIGWSRLAIMTEFETVKLGDGWVKQNGIDYSTSPLPYSSSKSSGKGGDKSGSWTPKGSNFTKGLTPEEAEDEYEEADFLESIGVTQGTGKSLVPYASNYTPMSGWTDGPGHHVVPLTEEYDFEDDKSGMAECEDCNASGQYYIVSGTTYIDIPHEYSSNAFQVSG